jgi:hypothetical protein
MEIHHRIEMINTLLEEADQKMHALDHALAAKALTEEQSEHVEDVTLRTEHHLWEQACEGLVEVRTILEDIEESERQRGVSM